MRGFDSPWGYASKLLPESNTMVNAAFLKDNAERINAVVDMYVDDPEKAMVLDVVMLIALDADEFEYAVSDRDEFASEEWLQFEAKLDAACDDAGIDRSPIEREFQSDNSELLNALADLLGSK